MSDTVYGMPTFLLLFFISTSWSTLPDSEYHKIPTRLKVQRTYHLMPGDQTLQGLINRRFPGLGLRTLRPRPNFPNGYQKHNESLYDNHIRNLKHKRSVAHESRKHLRKKLPHRPSQYRLKYLPYVQTHTKNRKADSPFY